MISHTRIYKLTFILSVLVFVPCLLCAEMQLFFFNPDANVKEFTRLVGSANGYLQSAGVDAKLQPFVKAEAMEGMVAAKKAPFAIVSSWYYNIAKDALSLEPLMMPSTGGKTVYKKVLLVRSGSATDVAAVSGKLATTSLGKENQKFLNDFVFKGACLNVGGLNIIWVQKDIDALLALKFRQVDAALVVERNVEILKKVSPQTVAGLEVIFTSPEIPESPLCALSGNADAGSKNRCQDHGSHHDYRPDKAGWKGCRRHRHFSG